MGLCLVERREARLDSIRPFASWLFTFEAQGEIEMGLEVEVKMEGGSCWLDGLLLGQRQLVWLLEFDRRRDGAGEKCGLEE